MHALIVSVFAGGIYIHYFNSVIWDCLINKDGLDVS